MSQSSVSPAGKRLRIMGSDVGSVQESEANQLEVSSQTNQVNLHEGGNDCDTRVYTGESSTNILGVNQQLGAATQSLTCNNLSSVSDVCLIDEYGDCQPHISTYLPSPNSTRQVVSRDETKNVTSNLQQSDILDPNDSLDRCGPISTEDEAEDGFSEPHEDYSESPSDFLDRYEPIPTEDETNDSIGDSLADNPENLMYVDDLEDLSGEDSSSGYEDVWVYRDTDRSDDSNDDEDHLDDYLPDEYLKHDPTPDTPYPRPDWITWNELRARKCGFASARKFPKRQNMYWFQRYASNSLWMIQRMQKTRKLQSHNGCVNCLDFNSSANLLCSGSDDLTVNIWDWRLKFDNKQGESIYTGHMSTVLQTRFCNQDTSIVTSGRDGTVRLIDIEQAKSELLMSSLGEIGQIAFTSPHTFLTCGTNGNVNLIDLRSRRPRKLFTVVAQNGIHKCRLHTISSHPLDKHTVAVAGSSPCVFLYDLRRIPRGASDIETKPTYCLGNLENQQHIVTSTAFNSLGDKLLISYNDEDLYVCDTKTCETLHKYTGHRNKRTIKGCAWFGDNYVLSGSDDGHIYGWDLESEHIVCFLEGDESVVNCIKVHPYLPVLATSGIEHDIKIWEAHANTWPQTMKGIKPQICRNTLRRKRAKRSLDQLDAASPSSVSVDQSVMDIDNYNE